MPATDHAPQSETQSTTFSCCRSAHLRSSTLGSALGVRSRSSKQSRGPPLRTTRENDESRVKAQTVSLLAHRKVLPWNTLPRPLSMRGVRCFRAGRVRPSHGDVLVAPGQAWRTATDTSLCATGIALAPTQADRAHCFDQRREGVASRDAQGENLYDIAKKSDVFLLHVRTLGRREHRTHASRTMYLYTRMREA